MEDITESMNRYRECARNLWNVYLLRIVPPHDRWENDAWDTKDEFDEICSKLFSALVLFPLECDLPPKSNSYEARPKPLPFLRVLPQSGDLIHINRDITPGGYWDYPDKPAHPEDVELHFIDYFDFDVMGFRDFEYLRVRIVHSTHHANHHIDLIGRDALVPSKYSKIYFKPTEISAGGPGRTDG